MNMELNSMKSICYDYSNPALQGGYRCWSPSDSWGLTRPWGSRLGVEIIHFVVARPPHCMRGY